jgi:formylglycine-generating enzyme required for sulfatase activity
LRCFNEGHKFPQKRPTAEEWRGTLEAALKEVIRCGKIDSHYYSKSYGKCYWCERASDLNFDIFPGKSIATVTSTPLPKVAPTPLTNFTENLPKGITLEMVGLPAGKFLMGSPDSDPYAENHEKPPHQVKVNSFAIGKYPITQAQYQAVMGNNPSHFKNNPQNPVEQVSWDDAQAFCQKLSQITGKTYRLPTEAEWEYACRAGTTTRFYFGDNDHQLGDYAWYDGNSRLTTHPVGQKKPNGWGLYDMSGNVWEWCEDDWHDSYKNAPDDGSAWIDNDNRSQSLKCLRGGSWFFYPYYCRSADRHWGIPDFLSYCFGFRVACVSPGL